MDADHLHSECYFNKYKNVKLQKSLILTKSEFFRNDVRFGMASKAEGSHLMARYICMKKLLPPNISEISRRLTEDSKNWYIIREVIIEKGYKDIFENYLEGEDTNIAKDLN